MVFLCTGKKVKQNGIGSFNTGITPDCGHRA